MAAMIIAYEQRHAGEVFVPFPGMRGHYIRTDKCVSMVACPHCQSEAGVPCKGSRDQYTSSTHWMRRSAARDKFGHGYPAQDMVPPDWDAEDLPPLPQIPIE